MILSGHTNSSHYQPDECHWICICGTEWTEWWVESRNMCHQFRLESMTNTIHFECNRNDFVFFFFVRIFSWPLRWLVLVVRRAFNENVKYDVQIGKNACFWCWVWFWFGASNWTSVRVGKRRRLYVFHVGRLQNSNGKVSAFNSLLCVVSAKDGNIYFSMIYVFRRPFLSFATLFLFKTLTLCVSVVRKFPCALRNRNRFVVKLSISSLFCEWGDAHGEPNAAFLLFLLQRANAIDTKATYWQMQLMRMRFIRWLHTARVVLCVFVKYHNVVSNLLTDESFHVNGNHRMGRQQSSTQHIRLVWTEKYVFQLIKSHVISGMCAVYRMSLIPSH